MTGVAANLSGPVWEDVVPLRILLLDDDRDDLEWLMGCLQQGMREPFEVVTARCLGEALQALVDRAVDVAVLDLQLPDAGHVQAVRDVHRRRPDVAIIALSGQPGVEDASLQAGAQDFLSKTEVTPRLLARSIGFALFQVREVELGELDASLQDLKRMTSSGSGTVLASQMAGTGPLKSRLPMLYNRLLLDYQALFRQYARAQALCSERPNEAMNDIVLQLGMHNSGPRDLMDLHVEMTEKASSRLGSQWEFDNISTLLVIELMGLLAQFYRGQQHSA